MQSGTHELGESSDDVTLTAPVTGEYLATRCGSCSGYKRDAVNGPYARIFRFVTKFCSCLEQKPTLTLSIAELERLQAIAAAG